MLFVINESNTAVITCELDQKKEKRRTLIYDMVGETFHGSSLTIEGGILEVKAKNMDVSPTSFLLPRIIQFPQEPLTDKSFFFKKKSQRGMFTWLKLHLREYVEQDLCIEVKLQGAHRRDHGPDRDENGSSEEAATHHAPKQATHDSTNTRILQHSRTRHCRPITRAPRWNREDRPYRNCQTQRRSDHRRKATQATSSRSRSRRTRISSRGHPSRATRETTLKDWQAKSRSGHDFGKNRITTK